MKCPACKSDDTKVSDSRQRGEKRMRRRECAACGKRFSTVEVLVGRSAAVPGQMLLFPLKVKKRNGGVEEFRRDKLMHSISTAHPPAHGGTALMEEILGEIQNDLPAGSSEPVSTAQIGEATMQVLAAYAPTAAAAYLLRHRRPADEEEMRAVLDEARALLSEEKKK